MSAKYGQLKAYRDRMQKLLDDMPEIIGKLAVGEGVYAVKQAKSLATERGVVNVGNYRRQFKADEKASVAGKRFWVKFYNNADYALFLEYGFRSHFVPGHWEGKSFVYQRGDPAGGMYVGPPGGYVPGHHVHRDATRRTKQTGEARLKRKFTVILKRYLEG